MNLPVGCCWVPFPCGVWSLVGFFFFFLKQTNKKQLKVFVKDGLTGCLLFCLPPLKGEKTEREIKFSFFGPMAVPVITGHWT